MLEKVKEFFSLDPDYEVTIDEGETFVVSGVNQIDKICCLEDNVLHVTVSLIEMNQLDETKQVEIFNRLLRSDRLVTRPHIATTEKGDIITIAGFAVLQDMGPEDEADIRMLFDFLDDDAEDIRSLLSDLRK